MEDSLAIEKEIEIADVRHNVERLELKNDEAYKEIKAETEAKMKEITIDKDSKFV